MKGEERYGLLLCELSLNFIWKVWGISRCLLNVPQTPHEMCEAYTQPVSRAPTAHSGGINVCQVYFFFNKSFPSSSCH